MAVPNLRHLHLSSNSNAMFLGSSVTEDIAVLNEQTTKVLQNLLAIDSCRLRVYTSVESPDVPEEKKTTADRTSYLSVDIVIYGSTTVRRSIGTLLSSARIYLQHPCYQDPNTEYDNPHVLDLTKMFANSGLSTPSRSGNQTPNAYVNAVTFSRNENVDSEDSQSKLYQKLSKVFGALTRPKSLKRLEADIRVTTTLLA